MTILTSVADHVTSQEDRIPVQQKIAYAMGMLVNNLQAAAIPAMVVILNLGLGMDPVLVGVIGFIPRIFDAISDPLMGYLSDSTRTRWGRRRPYILFGAVAAGLIFALMWQLPPGHSEEFYFWMFLAASILYFLVYTVYATPLVAFGFEMTADYHERTRLQAYANTIGQFPWLAVPWFYAIMASDFFDDTVHGARVLALWVGAAICLLGVVPAIFCREKSAAQQPAGEKVNRSGVLEHSVGIFSGFLTTLSCGPFLKLCAATFLVFTGFPLGASFPIYVMNCYLFAGDDGQAGNLLGWFGTLTSLSTFAVIPLAAWISVKIGKRKTFLLMISLSLVGYALKWIGYNPNFPMLLLVSCPFVACGIGSLFTLMGSMVADVCDHDELESHQRREGMFGAVYWWMVKVGMGIALLLTGILLNASGFDVNLESAQPEKTLFLLRVFDVVVPLATSMLALWIISTYEITEARAYEIRGELERRRGKLEAE